ncbi:MAG: hypothetical protein BGN88_12010 [Clostridiales bacterium 43-6]|nr:MAG: hypothetical protein BGN88_12010 [Clostridiales bacterium 43-6]
MKIGAQLYNLRDFTQNETDFEETFSKLNKIGFDMVQVSGIGPLDYGFIKTMMDKYNISVSGTHIWYEKLKNDLAGVIKDHKTIGATIVGLGAMPVEMRESYEGYMEFIEFANAVGKELSKEGMVFAYHNHSFEFQKFGGKTGMDLIVENTDPDCVGFIPDVYWLQHGGVTPAEYLDKLGTRTKICHFKDMEYADGGPRFTELGNGNINFKPILKVLQKYNVEFAAIEEDTCYNYEPFEALNISLNYIKELSEHV